jgi:hypothetical protein
MTTQAFANLGTEHQLTVLRESLYSMCDLPRIYLLDVIDLHAGHATPDQLRSMQTRHEAAEKAFRESIAAIESVDSLIAIFKVLFKMFETIEHKDNCLMPRNLRKLLAQLGE